MLTAAVAVWRGVPCWEVVGVVLLLFVVGEWYPFSNFPMYSKLGEEVELIYLTDEGDRPLPMDEVVRTGSGTVKKMYERELKRVGGEGGVAERARAGGAVLETLMGRLRRRVLPTGVVGVRLYRREVALVEGKLVEGVPERLAERGVAGK